MKTTDLIKSEWRGELPYINGKPTEYIMSPGACTTAKILFNMGGIFVALSIDSLPHLLNLYRDLGSLLDELQPGLTNPLPDGSADELDAIKVSWEADQLQRGIK